MSKSVFISSTAKDLPEHRFVAVISRLFPRLNNNHGIASYNLDAYSQAITDYQQYQRLAGHLEPFMQQQMTEMQVVLQATP